MKALSVDPMIARKSLANLFSDHLEVLPLLHSMNDSQIVVLSAVIDGKKLTTAGNCIDADFEVTRLSAIVENLEKKYFFPIEHRNVSAKSTTTGRATLQTVYFMPEEDVARLLSDPGAVFSEKEQSLFFKSLESEEKKIGKLIESKGGLPKAMISMVKHAYKDKPLDPKLWDAIATKFNSVLNELDAA